MTNTNKKKENEGILPYGIQHGFGASGALSRWKMPAK